MSASLTLPFPSRTSAPRFADWLAAWRRGEPGFFGLGLLLLGLMLPTGFAALVDSRLFQGVDVWEKPLKFEFALAVYVLTLALFAQALPQGTVAKRWYRIFRAAVIAAILAEMVWIGAAAALGTASHFNTGPVGQVVYPLMGVLAVLLTSASAVFAWQIARNRQTGLSPALKEGLVIGLGLTLPLTLITAGTMSGMGSHFIGGSGSDAGGLLFLGWSRDGGDLRVAHFIATHAMHFIPAFGLVSEQLWGGTRQAPVRLFAAGFVALIAFTFVQALTGRPFLPFLG